jgi:hypothetical protein
LFRRQFVNKRWRQADTDRAAILAKYSNSSFSCLVKNVTTRMLRAMLLGKGGRPKGCVPPALSVFPSVSRHFCMANRNKIKIADKLHDAKA